MPKLLCVFVITNIQVNLNHLKGQLDPPVGHIVFLDHQGVSWIPLLVRYCFWITNEVSWIPLLVT